MNKKMTKDTPKVLSPDLEAPSASLRKEAYERAAAVWEMEPWVDFIEEQVLAIRFADGTERFLSVLGSHGEYRALALYPDAASYWRVFEHSPCYTAKTAFADISAGLFGR